MIGGKKINMKTGAIWPVCNLVENLAHVIWVEHPG